MAPPTGMRRIRRGGASGPSVQPLENSNTMPSSSNPSGTGASGGGGSGSGGGGVEMLTRARKSVMAPGDESTVGTLSSAGTFSKDLMGGTTKLSTSAGAAAAGTAAASGTSMPSLTERLLKEHQAQFQKQQDQKQQDQQQHWQQQQPSSHSVISGGNKSVISSGTMSKKKKFPSSTPSSGARNNNNNNGGAGASAAAIVMNAAPSSSNSTGSFSKKIMHPKKKPVHSEFDMEDYVASNNEESVGKKPSVSGRMDNSYYNNTNNTTNYNNNNNNMKSDKNSGRLSLAQKLKRATPFKNTKRTMNMVYSAFGNCTKQAGNNNHFDYDNDDDGTMNLEAGDFEKTALLYGGTYFQKKQQQRKRQKMVLQLIAGCLLFMGIMGMIRRGKSSKNAVNGTTNSSNSNNNGDNGILSSLPLLPTPLRNYNLFSSSSNMNHVVHQAVFPPYFQGLSNLTSVYNPKKETPYFWDIHFSGESIAEAVFGHCHGLVQACEFGLRQPDYSEDKLATFELDGIKYVNVDTTTLPGIIRANKLQLSQSHVADIVISPHVHEMAARIFSPEHPGRMFALFRHPVDRALGMYYYLQKATWDSMYNPTLAKMTMEEYAKSQYIENNWMTRFLVQKPRGKLRHSDMLLAKKIIKFKCLVGLYDDIEASLVRFERYFGWGVHDRSHKHGEISKCRRRFLDDGDRNFLGHPVSVKEGRPVPGEVNDGLVKAGSKAWDAILRQNVFDMELYEFARQIYKIQGKQIFGVAS